MGVEWQLKSSCSFVCEGRRHHFGLILGFCHCICRQFILLDKYVDDARRKTVRVYIHQGAFAVLLLCLRMIRLYSGVQQAAVA